jgi:NAD(P)-dependent dehydrogenase (short-subunit alcohol dehydrogenase family)/pimeloyl-ACP methyl ester carboxylesterase
MLSAPAFREVRLPAGERAGGRQLAASECGSEDAQTLVICLPGLLESRHVFRPVLALAARHPGSRFLAIDYCGRGESDPLPCDEPYRASVYLEDIAGLIASLRACLPSRARICLLGSSMGGLLALHLAQDPARRLHTVVLNDVGGRLDWQALQRLYQGLLRPLRGSEPRPSPAQTGMDPRVLDAVRMPGHWDLPIDADLWGMRLDSLLRGAQARVGVVHCTDSPLCPVAIAQAAKFVRPNLMLHSVAGDTHPAPWNAQVVRWVASCLELDAMPAVRAPAAVTTPEAAHILERPVRDARTALVTGANSGIGRETALALAAQGWHLVLAGRSWPRTQPVLDAIAALPGAPSARFLPLALDDLVSVRQASEAFLALGSPLDLLINNAGVAGTRGLTASGFEHAFGVNHIGHFALTLMLWPALRAAGHARVINVASRAHRWAGRWDWDQLRQPTRSWSGAPEYARSKLANVLFSAELARRARHTGISSFAVHPGVVHTDIWRRLPGPLRTLNRLRLIDARAGAQTSLHCALRASPQQSGLYFADCAPARTSKLGDDPVMARELWARSLRWLAMADPLV